MKKRIQVLFFFLCAFIGKTYAKPGVCIVSFLEKNHPYNHIISDIFKTSDRAYVVLEAFPTDFLSCIEADYSEILIIAHTLKIVDQDGLKLGYQTTRVVNDQQYIVETQPILNNIFKKSLSTLNNKKKNGKKIFLKEIRFFSCDPEETFKSYPDLKKIINDYYVYVDVSPANSIASFFKDQRVSSIDIHWLKESLFPENSSNEEDYFYAYLPLETYLFYQKGRGRALHGKYRVYLEGVALGLAEKMSVLYIKYSDVKDLKIGEIKSFFTPNINISAALFLNIELGISPVPKIQLPSESNSLGFSLSLFSKISISRVY